MTPDPPLIDQQSMHLRYLSPRSNPLQCPVSEPGSILNKFTFDQTCQTDVAMEFKIDIPVRYSLHPGQYALCLLGGFIVAGMKDETAT